METGGQEQADSDDGMEMSDMCVVASALVK